MTLEGSDLHSLPLEVTMYYVVSNLTHNSLYAGSYEGCLNYLRTHVAPGALEYVDIVSGATKRCVSWVL
jgi:hypothetical protein